MKVGIIGGGASGMMSAILLNREGFDVTILEKNSTLGKKILMTGNGRCNYFNQDIGVDKYYTSDYEFLKTIPKGKVVKLLADGIEVVNYKVDLERYRM